VFIDVPDREARRRLVGLYRRGLELDESRLDQVLDRTEGVTASFVKELLRRAAVVAAERAPGDGVRVSADDLDAALDELLDTRHRMTRRALGLDDGEGGQAASGAFGRAPDQTKSAVGEQGGIGPGIAPPGG
jgi:hypothetical protein